MKSCIINILSLLLLVSLINCAEEEVTRREYPRLKTSNVTDITPEGAVFNTEFVFRGDFEILNYGFVWGASPDPGIETSDRVVIEGDIQSNTFSKQIITTLAEGKKYYVRAFVKTEEFLVYGQTTDFVSLGSQAPVIQGFYPQDGSLGDTILIKGKNFSYVENKVFFAENLSQIVSATDTSLNVIVPDQIYKSDNTISVSVKNNTMEAEETFHILPPQLTELFPKSARTYDTIKIEGIFIGQKPEHVKVNFERDKILSPTRNDVISNSSNEISVVVPQKLKEDSKIWVTIAGMTDSIEFNYRRPILKYLDKDTVNWAEEVKLGLQNGYSETSLFDLYLNDKNIEVKSANDTLINFMIPTSLNSTSSQLSLKIAGFDLIWSQPLILRPLKIRTISADSIGLGEEVSLAVDNLHPTDTRVFINGWGIDSEVATDLKVLKFRMPLEANYYVETMAEKEATITIEANRTFIEDTTLLFKIPKISSINKQIVEIDEEVVIKGINFNPAIHKLRLMDEDLEIKSSTTSEIRFTIPNRPEILKKRNSLNQIIIEIVLNESIKIDTNLVLKAPLITDFSPYELNSLDDVITVKGINFGNSPIVEFANDGGLIYNSETKFELDNSKIEIISSSDNEIQFRINNAILQNDKISQKLISKIKIKSFGLYTESENPILYDHKTYWNYEVLQGLYSQEHNSLLNQSSGYGVIVGGYSDQGLRSIYGISTRFANLLDRKFLTVAYPEWTNSNDPQLYIKNSFAFNGELYIQTSAGKIRRTKFKSSPITITGWEDVPIIGNYGSTIHAEYEHNFNLHLLSASKMIRVTDSDTTHLQEFSSSDYDVLFSRKVDDKFFIAIENRTSSATNYEVHMYNITNDSWELINSNFTVPSEKPSRNPDLGNYLFDENYIYNYDFITGDKSVLVEFPENFSSRDNIDLLFSVSGKLFFYVNDDKMLILD